MKRVITIMMVALGLAGFGAEPWPRTLDEETVALVETFAGHIAVLPGLNWENLETTVAGRTLVDSGLKPNLVWLTPAQLVDTNFLTARRFPLVLYLGGEAYLQTVRRAGDGDEAIRRYLGEGGTFFALPSGPLPFYYNPAGKPVASAGRFGFNIAAASFDAQPAGRTLTFQVNTNQDVFHFPKSSLLFPAANEADQRWRAIGNPNAEGVRYVPVLSLRDERGQAYADGAAFLEHEKGAWAGARLLYVWCSLLANDEVRLAVLRDGFRYALANRTPPPASLVCRRALRAPVVNGRLDDPAWRDAPKGEFHAMSAGVPRRAASAATVQSRWDDQCLFLALRCVQRRLPDGAFAPADFVHFRFDRGRDGKAQQVFWLSQFNELRVPNSTNADRGVEQLQGIKSATREESGAWLAEVAIPWGWFQGMRRPPLLDTELAVQLARVIPSAGSAEAERSVWSPVDDVQRLDRFGVFVLAADPLADDFEGRAEPARGSADWRLTAGLWKIEAGALVGEGCVADGYETKGAARGGNQWRDYVFSVRFRVESRGSDWRDGPWFGVRCRADGDGYYLTFTDRDCQLHKVVYGLSTTDTNALARAAWKPDNAWHSLRVQARGNRVEAALDDRPLLQAKDNAHLNLPSVRSGGIVLSARQGSVSRGKTVVRFDDVIVEPLKE